MMNISWMNVSNSELLFWGGVVLMAAAALLAAGFTVIFVITGHTLKRRLEQEYGKPER